MKNHGQQITPSGYTASWHLYTDAESREIGFITNYARSNINEDFAEMASMMLINSKSRVCCNFSGN